MRRSSILPHPGVLFSYPPPSIRWPGHVEKRTGSPSRPSSPCNLAALVVYSSKEAQGFSLLLLYIFFLFFVVVSYICLFAVSFIHIFRFASMIFPYFFIISCQLWVVILCFPEQISALYSILYLQHFKVFFPPFYQTFESFVNCTIFYIFFPLFSVSTIDGSGYCNGSATIDMFFE